MYIHKKALLVKPGNELLVFVVLHTARPRSRAASCDYVAVVVDKISHVIYV